MSDSIKPEVRALIERGNITSEEVAQLRCNSEEWEAVRRACDDKAFIEGLRHCLDNCRRPQRSTYEHALQYLFVPELLRRFEMKIEELNTKKKED